MQKCKTIVLKCVSIMRLIIGVKNPTEELTGIYFFTLVVGYFAYAQYDGEITDILLSLDMTCFF